MTSAHGPHEFCFSPCFAPRLTMLLLLLMSPDITLSLVRPSVRPSVLLVEYGHVPDPFLMSSCNPGIIVQKHLGRAIHPWVDILAATSRS
jgi:hypothetical protein